MKKSNKAQNVMQISSSTIITNRTPKGYCNNLECIKKKLITHYNNRYWRKHLELWAKYALNQICLCRSQRNLQRDSSSTVQEIILKTKLSIKRNSWQPKVLVIRRPKQDWWLMNNAVNIHLCNNLRLIIDFIEKSTNIGRLTADGVFLDNKTSRIR